MEETFYQQTSEQKKSYGIARENIRYFKENEFSITKSNGRKIAQISVQIWYVPQTGDLIKKAKFDDNSNMHIALYK